MSGMMTRRCTSLRNKPEDVVKVPTASKKVTKPKKSSSLNRKNVQGSSSPNQRKSKRLAKRLSVSTKMNTANKENSAEPSQTTKKFFKHINPKDNIEGTYTKTMLLGDLRKPKVKPRVRKTVKVNNKMRQMSLKESLCKQEQARTLRPRQNDKNYCEDSKLIQKVVSPTAKKSIVLVEKLDINNEKKLPVYKCIKSPDESFKNKTDIYDFKFEESDTKAKLMKRKKRKIVKKQGTKKMAKKRVKENPPEKDLKSNEQQDAAGIKSIDKVAVADTNQKEKPGDDMQIGSEESMTVPDIRKDQGKQHEAKPHIISVTNLSNNKINLITSDDNGDKVRSLQTKDAVNKGTTEYKNMINDTLLNKSLSPIKKVVVTFDPNSPWRAPTLDTFSQVKSLYQSTPRINTVNVSAHRTAKQNFNVKNGVKNIRTTNADKISDNSYVPPAANEGNFSKKTSLVSPRKFGTEITNVTQLNTNKHLNQSNTLNSTFSKSNAEQIMRGKLSESVITSNTQILNASSNSHVAYLPTFDEQFVDKENTVQNLQSPIKKSPKKKVTALTASPLRSKNVSNMLLNTENTLSQPQPGPSGFQTKKLQDSSATLRQLNLNNFLNITEMPESTRITTKHGIFGDAHSTPISAKISIKPQKSEANVENAFGFSDDSDLDISPIKINKTLNESRIPLAIKDMNKQPYMPVPGRLSVGQIKNKLFQKKFKNKKDQDKKPQLTVDNIKENDSLMEKKNVAIDAVSFSDTFDMLSEAGDLSKGVPDPPLFVDLEPSHFVQPPRHSYKRKRNVRFSFTEDESEIEMEEDTRKQEYKKRKVTKLNKEEEKRLEEWVKNVNETFEEIDHYDLVVE